MSQKTYDELHIPERSAPDAMQEIGCSCVFFTAAAFCCLQATACADL